MFARSRKILTLQGFDIKVDPSWVLIATLITWSLATQYFPIQLPSVGSSIYVVLAVAAMLGFFASLILHELAHAVVARRYGVEIKGITLFVFGGVAELGSEPKTPGSEFLIAVAGPIMSLLLSLGFWFVSFILAQFSLPALSSVLGYLALINLILALFNMLPAFPLDGGRIFRAYLWSRNSDFLKATQTATTVGSAFAYGLMALGIFGIISGALIAGLWQIFIGMFLLTAARGTYQSEFIKNALKDKTVALMMTKDTITASPDETLSAVVNQTMLQKRVSFVPVIDEGVLLGYVDGDVVSKIDREHWQRTKIGDVYVPLGEDNIVSKDLPADQVMKRMSETGMRKFLVADGQTLLGVITLSDLLGYLAVLQQVHSGAATPFHRMSP